LVTSQVSGRSCLKCKWLRRVHPHVGCFFKDEFRGWLRQRKYLLQVKAERCPDYEEAKIVLDRVEVTCPSCGVPSILDCSEIRLELPCGHLFKMGMQEFLKACSSR